jgi:hypothetical protein
MTNVEVKTATGATYVEQLPFVSIQEACDEALRLLYRGYSVNLAVEGNTCPLTNPVARRATFRR